MLVSEFQSIYRAKNKHLAADGFLSAILAFSVVAVAVFVMSQQCASCQRVELPVIGANPLANCTSDPSGGGGGVEGTEERDRKTEEGRIPYFDPLALF
jgi:hypothetical protein